MAKVELRALDTESAAGFAERTIYDIDSICCKAYIKFMAWDVEGTDEFRMWFQDLTDAEAESVATVVDLLEARGPHLGFPHTSQITTSHFGQMRELRIQHQGCPYRVLYAFDPRRTALLLLGGEKTGDDRWYERFVPKADALFKEHLRSLEDQ